MSASSAAVLVDQMLEATRQAQEFVEGLNRAEFLADKRTQQAVTLNLIILGEAASRLMDRHPEFVAANPGIEWRSIRGMRNRIAHGYYDIDMVVVWDTVTSALPELEITLAGIGTQQGPSE